MSNPPGYLLPDGEAYTEEMECCMVFVPAKPEYRRAFFGALDYFGTWLAWERDSGKRGKDAARAWKLANEMTQECWDMGACELMLAELVAIRNLLSEQHCCDGNNTITYYDNTVVTTTIVPGVGGYPTSWGESETPTSWDDWSQYVCYHAHEYVDYLIESSETLDTMIEVGSWGVDFLGFILSRLIYGSPGGIPVPVNFGWVSNISNALLDALDTLEFDTMAAKIESGREDIVCALMSGTSLEDAVEATVDNSLLWTVFYSWLDFDSTVATIYTGEVPGVGYLVPEQKADCDCDEPQPAGELSPNYHWRSDSSSWTLTSPVVYQDLEGTYDGFEIDGIIYYSVSTYPQSHTYWKSDTIAWPGGQVNVKVRARSSSSGSASIRNTYVVVNMYRASDNALLDSYSTTHGSPVTDYRWSEQTDYSDSTDHSAQDVYITVAIDGTDNYGGRYVDYVSLQVRP